MSDWADVRMYATVDVRRDVAVLVRSLRATLNRLSLATEPNLQTVWRPTGLIPEGEE